MDKKELKRKYKEIEQPIGLFVITNHNNGKIFIGSGVNLPGNINSQRFQLKNGLHRNKDLQREYSECAGEGFTFEILDRILPREGDPGGCKSDLKELESLWLEKLLPYDEKGYHKRRS